MHSAFLVIVIVVVAVVVVVVDVVVVVANVIVTLINHGSHIILIQCVLVTVSIKR